MDVGYLSMDRANFRSRDSIILFCLLESSVVLNLESRFEGSDERLEAAWIRETRCKLRDIRSSDGEDLESLIVLEILV